MYVFFIPVLRYIKFGQVVRDLGPRSHQKKTGTPTLGGTIIVLSALIIFSVINFMELHISLHLYFLLIMPLIMYAMIGLVDDYLIVVKKNNQGLSARFKLFLQIIWAGAYFLIFLSYGLDSKVNFFGLIIDLKWFYGALILLMMVGGSNSVNLSDGLDGLATGLSIIAFLFVGYISYRLDNYPVLYFCITIVGSLLAFLCFNYHPAKLFMGDTGSLALGATLASVCIILKIEMLLPIIGVVFLLETVSVMLQVLYFKKTKGKRLFLMTPLHHHFELKGLKEKQVDYLFWGIAFIGGIVGSILFGLLY